MRLANHILAPDAFSTALKVKPPPNNSRIPQFVFSTNSSKGKHFEPVNITMAKTANIESNPELIPKASDKGELNIQPKAVKAKIIITAFRCQW